MNITIGELADKVVELALEKFEKRKLETLEGILNITEIHTQSFKVVSERLDKLEKESS